MRSEAEQWPPCRGEPPGGRARQGRDDRGRSVNLYLDGFPCSTPDLSAGLDGIAWETDRTEHG